MRLQKKPIDQTPSRLLTKFAKEITLNSSGLIVDVASGYGRNAIFLSSFGVPVLCIDNNRGALDCIKSSESPILKKPKDYKLLDTLELDLIDDPWPFNNESLGAIINVHFLTAQLLGYFLSSLKIGGYLFIETVGGYGGNYLQLLPQGYIKEKLGDAFETKFFIEKKVGPQESNASAVKLFAIKKRVIQISRF